MNLSPESMPVDTEPPVILDSAYVDRLHGLATAARQRAPDLADRLLEEIDRARIVASEAIPADVVNIGCRVRFHDAATGQTHTVTLVLPPDADIAERRVSVLTPVGVALIGLTKGASIAWETPAGESRRLTVLEVGGGGDGPPR